MLKKYLPLIFLIAAGVLFFWIKQHQRGPAVRIPIEPQTVPVSAPEQPVIENEPIDRSISKIIYSKHARCRMDCRHIDESEVKEILKEGVINYNKVEESEKGKTYPLEGVTHDKQHVRIVIAPHTDELVVVTVIDLDKEWSCDCK
ncbi:MAG: DUF4258 domain-containing protein [Ferruginibacter sp.]